MLIWQIAPVVKCGRFFLSLHSNVGYLSLFIGHPPVLAGYGRISYLCVTLIYSFHKNCRFDLPNCEIREVFVHLQRVILHRFTKVWPAWVVKFERVLYLCRVDLSFIVYEKDGRKMPRGLFRFFVFHLKSKKKICFLMKNTYFCSRGIYPQPNGRVPVKNSTLCTSRLTKICV